MTALGIRWDGLVKDLGGRRILDGFSLDVAPGEAVALLGGSGTGKSVALRHAIGLLEPDEGRVFVGEQDLAALDASALREVRRQVAFVFQSGALFDSLSVSENVGFALRDLDAGAREERVAEMLALVDLPGIEDRMPADLSGGMARRVALARALAIGPAAVLYDEPTTGLDPVATRRINELIRDLQDRLGVTSVVVTHDVKSAFAVADRIAYLREGRVVFDGDVAAARGGEHAGLAAFMDGRSPAPE
ncbi:MAG: ATP-binding cassette domain-containing protein [Acidobacteriota bacterium]